MLYNNIHCFKEGMIIKQTIEHSTLIRSGNLVKEMEFKKKDFDDAVTFDNY